MERLRGIWESLRSSLWFVPGIIVMVCIGLAIGLIELDALIGDKLERKLPAVFHVGADGARAILSTIASSYITVAGVSFSVVVVALSLASNQYSSRVLTTFMRDSRNQATLGALIGVFAYCLMVLRTVQGDPEGYVPSLALAGALVMALLGIGFFVYFVHHIATAIQAAHILASVARDTRRAVDHLFPEELGEEAEPQQVEPVVRGPWREVPAEFTGYIQRVDSKALLKFAQKRGVIVRMERAIGEFVSDNQPLVTVASPAPLDSREVRHLQRLFTIGTQRSVDQDAGHGIRQMVDMALKGLSPGINDTTTVLMCLDYLTAVECRLAARRMEGPYRRDGEALQVIARVPSFGDFLDAGFGPIRRNATGNIAVLSRLLLAFDLVGRATTSEERRSLLLRQVELVEEVVHRTVEAVTEREELEGQAWQVATRLATPRGGRVPEARSA